MKQLKLKMISKTDLIKNEIYIYLDNEIEYLYNGINHRYFKDVKTNEIIKFSENLLTNITKKKNEQN